MCRAVLPYFKAQRAGKSFNFLAEVQQPNALFKCLCGFQGRIVRFVETLAGIENLGLM